MTDSQNGSLPRQRGYQLPRRSRAVLPDLGHDRWPSARVLPVKHHAQGPRELGHILLPFRQLAESRVPLGDRLVALNLPGQAHGRDGILHGYGLLACFDALIAAPEHQGGQLIDAGHLELPGRADGGTTFIHAGVLPPGGGAGCSSSLRRSGWQTASMGRTVLQHATGSSLSWI